MENKKFIEIQREVNFEAYLKYFCIRNKEGYKFRISKGDLEELSDSYEDKILATRTFLQKAMPVDYDPYRKYANIESMVGEEFVAYLVYFNTDEWTSRGKEYSFSFEEYKRMGKPDKININQLLTFTNMEELD